MSDELYSLEILICFMYAPIAASNMQLCSWRGMPCNGLGGSILILSMIGKRKASAIAAAGCPPVQTRQKPVRQKHFSDLRLPLLRLAVLCETNERNLWVSEYYVDRAGHAGYKQSFLLGKNDRKKKWGEWSMLLPLALLGSFCTVALFFFFFPLLRQLCFAVFFCCRPCFLLFWAVDFVVHFRLYLLQMQVLYTNDGISRKNILYAFPTQLWPKGGWTERRVLNKTAVAQNNTYFTSKSKIW